MFRACCLGNNMRANLDCFHTLESVATVFLKLEFSIQMKAFLITTQSFNMAFTVVKSAGEFCGTVSAPQHSRTLSSQNVGIKVNIEPRLSIGTLEHRLRCAFSIKLSVFSRNRLISEELFCELLASLSYHEVDDGNEKIIIIKNSVRAAQFLADFFAVITRLSLSNLIGMAIQFQFQLDPPISTRYYGVTLSTTTQWINAAKPTAYIFLPVQ